MGSSSKQSIESRFASASEFFICPVCQADMILEQEQGFRLSCESKHSFDIAREGYVHLLLAHQRRSNKAGYAKTMLRARRELFEAGFYRPLQEALVEYGASRYPQGGSILDAGCGEGSFLSYFLKQQSQAPWQGLNTDIAKEGVRLAAKASQSMSFVANLSKGLPLHSASIDLIANVFSPANPSDFARILKPGASLLKFMPGKEHLKEFRDAIFLDNRKEELDASLALPDFEGHFDLVESRRIRYAFALSAPTTNLLLEASPLSWKGDREKINLLREKGLPEVTVDAMLYCFENS